MRMLQAQELGKPPYDMMKECACGYNNYCDARCHMIRPIWGPQSVHRSKDRKMATDEAFEDWICSVKQTNVQDYNPSSYTGQHNEAGIPLINAARDEVQLH